MPTQKKQMWDVAPTTKGTYSVRKNDDVTLTVTIGSGQYGSIRVRVNGNKVGAGQERLHIALGKGADLIGSGIAVLAVVNDVNPMTNRTEVTWVFAGGPKPSIFHQEHVAQSDWGVVLFPANFDIVRA